ncbi:2-dehydro-3-deoxygluconokinase [Paenibacillus swuensis]|uniref:2-dehydro-3-deoxygluconokinase n=1 Tax=Paenibacillus swuensis TaxID=1178515 RepID=A0A172TNA9_9BACL|nr:sugar kinase [Paenibacillus swuensis]ANE48374.1 2-dehydro-3-deoxygluconokinase [Paenibacillus swuensis]
MHKKSLDIITFGESMGLFYPEGTRGLGQGGPLAQSFGGAESNVAIGLARLGCRPGWFSLLGDDPVGTGIHQALRGEGVDVSRVRFTNEAPTGLMLRESLRGKLSVYYYRAGSAASLLKASDIDADYIASASILHITGITPALGEGCIEAVREAVRIAKANGVVVSFDPNLRLKLWSLEQARPILLELAAAADYFLPGYDELKLLWESEDEAFILDQAAKLPGISVIKSAGVDNLILEPGKAPVRIPFERAEQVVDTVGAGDGFCAGFLAGISKGYSTEEAVRLGGLTGSLVVQAPGDWEALPTWREVERIRGLSSHIER